MEKTAEKKTVLAQRLQEQTAAVTARLAAAAKERAAAVAEAEALGTRLAEQSLQHEATLAAQQAAHEQRRTQNEELGHENRQQAIVVAELEARSISLAARMDDTQQHNAALRRYATATGAAYGRLAAHAEGLHQQLSFQLAALLHMCRHLSLQLAGALAAADPLGHLVGDAGAEGSSSPAAAPAASSVAAAALAMGSLRTELQVATQMLEQQAGSGEAQRLAAVPASVAEALAADLAGLPAELLASPQLEAPWPGVAASGAAAVAAVKTAPADASQQSPAAGALSAQVGQMESQLEALVHSGAELAARASAATLLHQGERAERQRAQDLAADLSARLLATQVGERGG